MFQEICFNKRKINFNYDFFESYVAGIQLLGSEIKSIRINKASIVDSFCKLQNNELYIINMYISKYKLDSQSKNYIPYRKRKLLLKRSELVKIDCNSTKYGFTIIPIKLFINNKGIAKLKIALVKGKKKNNKRDFLKNKEIKKYI